MNLIVPNNIITYLINKAQSDPVNGRTARKGHRAAKVFVLNALRNFHDSHKNQMNRIFMKFPVDKTIERFIKDGKASEELCDLIALYITDGKSTFKELAPDHFSTRVIKQTNEHEAIIHVRNQHQILTPVFPPAPAFQPRWPATDEKRIRIGEHENIIIKDESVNPTGTHKDRMAWEITTRCHQHKYEDVCIITSGSAGIAIQHFFNLFASPSQLRVLVDKKLNEDIKHTMQRLGAKVIEHNLSEKMLSSEEIRGLTGVKKSNGKDFTHIPHMDAFNLVYFDWLSYEILSLEPDYCFIPYGTGDLYHNILNIVLKEDANFNNLRPFDNRFKSTLDTVRNCHFIGATCKKQHTKLEKLFSHFNVHYPERLQSLAYMKGEGIIGDLSGIHEVDERSLEEAMGIMDDNKINAEPSALAGLMLFIEHKHNIPPEKKVVIINTGKTNLEIEKAEPVRPKVEFIFA